MRKFSLKQRINFFIDSWFAKGTWSLLLLLFISTLLAIALMSLLLIAGDVDLPFGLTKGKELTNPILRLMYVFWGSILRTLDPGTMGQDDPNSYGIMMLMMTLIGIFMISSLIGIINQAIASKIASLRRGKSEVIISNHTVILGWTDQILVILKELITANANHKKQNVLVMANKDKIEMEEIIRLHIQDQKTTTIYCRTGNLLDVSDLNRLNLDTAKAVIVLPYSHSSCDISVIKTLLAVNSIIQNSPNFHQIPVVASLKHAANIKLAESINQRILCIDYGDVIGKLMAHSSLQPGLSHVYRELYDFAGSEIYIFPYQISFQGKTYHEMANRFPQSCLIGLILATGKVVLNPQPGIRIRKGDRMIVIAEDDDTTYCTETAAKYDESQIVEARQSIRKAKNVLMLGWNWRCPAIVKELEQFSLEGSKLLIVPCEDEEHFDKSFAGLNNLRKLNLEWKFGNITDRDFLNSLVYGELDHIMLVSCFDPNHFNSSDDRVMITLLILRDILNQRKATCNIITEMSDDRNRALIKPKPGDDIVISDRLVSMMMTQVAENGELLKIFQSLLNSLGSEIYLKPIEDYVVLSEPVHFATLVESALRKNESAIGVQIAKRADGAEIPQIILNPPKTKELTFEAGDKIVVVAVDWD